MNSMKEIKSALKALGANNNAIKFFECSFTLGRSPISKIAQHIKMDRSSAYLACDELVSLGLLNVEVVRNRKIVWAKPPRSIISRLRTRIRQLKTQCLNIETQMPELLAAYEKSDSQPVLQYFSGKDGLRQITDDVLESAQGEILLYSNQAEEKNVFTDLDHKAFIKARKQNDIFIRVLAPDTPEAHNLKKTDSLSLRETRIIYDEEIPFKCETYIYADKIAMLEFRDQIQGFIVRSEEFNHAQRWLFEKVWKICESTNKGKGK